MVRIRFPPAERCYGAGGEDGNFVAYINRWSELSSRIHRFAIDSPLEQAGFEPPVPRNTMHFRTAFLISPDSAEGSAERLSAEGVMACW